MQIQLSIFLYIYLVFVAIWIIFNLVAVYHMLKYGLKSPVTYITTIIFISVSIMIMYYSYVFIAGINWGIDLPILNYLIPAEPAVAI